MSQERRNVLFSGSKLLCAHKHAPRQIVREERRKRAKRSTMQRNAGIIPDARRLRQVQRLLFGTAKRATHLRGPPEIPFFRCGLVQCA